MGGARCLSGVLVARGLVRMPSILQALLDGLQNIPANVDTPYFG